MNLGYQTNTDMVETFIDIPSIVSDATKVLKVGPINLLLLCCLEDFTLNSSLGKFEINLGWYMGLVSYVRNRAYF